MATPRSILLVLPRIVCAAVAFCACLPAPVSAIRKDIGLAAPIMCRSTVQGRHLISDDNGYVCSALSINPWSRCCPRTGARFSCQGCKLDLQCCNSYEYCVSCCLNPSRTKEGDVLKLKVAKPVTAGTYTSIFYFCMGRCRHSSASVVHENAYVSDFHHCFPMQQNSSGSTESNPSSRLAGINVIMGRQGESCSSVCRAKGQSCVPSRLSALNKCEILQKYMRCKSGCFRSLGLDQPAQVVDEAPSNLIPPKMKIPACCPSRLLQLHANLNRNEYISVIVEHQEAIQLWSIKKRFSCHSLKSSNCFLSLFLIQIQEHACTCRWMSGSHVMARINIPRGSVLARDMDKKIGSHKRGNKWR